jgi:Uma2 family endonuclease
MPSLIIPAGAPLIAGPEQSRWANADWERLPNDSTRYEIIDGMLYLTTAPGTFHERLTVAFMQYVGIPAIERGPAYVLTAHARASLPEYATIDPMARTLSHSRLVQRGRRELVATAAGTDRVVFDCRPALGLTVASLFAGAPDETC